MHWKTAFHKRGKGLLLWCLFQPLPNNQKGPDFPSTVFFIGWKHHKASFISLAFWQFFSKCKCYIWKRQESSLLPESLLLSLSCAELLLLAATCSNITLYWRDSMLSPHLLNFCLFLKSQLTFGACSLMRVGHPAIPQPSICKIAPSQTHRRAWKMITMKINRSLFVRPGKKSISLAGMACGIQLPGVPAPPRGWHWCIMNINNIVSACPTEPCFVHWDDLENNKILFYWPLAGRV